MSKEGARRLDSWKSIAEFLGRDVSTVRRWEHECGLPVRRVAGTQGRSVYAFTDELEEWLGRRTDGARPADCPPGKAAGRSAPDLVGSGRLSASTAAPATPDAPQHPKRARYLWIAATLATISVAGAYWFWHPQPELTSKDLIVLADIANSTGDPVFDGTLREGLRAQLSQSPFLNMLSEQQVAGTLRLMSRSPKLRLDNAVARQVCLRNGAEAMLEGSIGQIGGEYNLTLSAVNCSTGALLATAQAVAPDKSHVLDALGDVASSIRSKLGESFASIRRFNKPLANVTTPSLEALQAYTRGWGADLTGKEFEAITSLKRAIELDPDFAMAYAVLGTVFHNLGETDLAAENLDKAYSLRERVSEREDFYISSHYEAYRTEDLEKADQIYELWAQTYPSDLTPRINLAADDYTLGRFDKAVAAGRGALDLAPDAALAYVNLANTYLHGDLPNDAAGIIRQARAHGVDSPYLHEAAYEIAFLKGDEAGMTREANWATGRPGIEIMGLGWQSDRAASAGRFNQANDFTEEAVGLAEQAGQTEAVAELRAEAAASAALAGFRPFAGKEALEALHHSRGRVTESAAAVALAFAGKVSEAQKTANDLARRFPQGSVVQFIGLPTIRAAISLAQNSPEKAIVDLRAASPYDLAPPGFLLPIYTRGLAYLEAGRGGPAAVEFRKILGQSRLAVYGILPALAQLGLARARVLSGDSAGARKAYLDFFGLLEYADPDLPVLRRAKAEYAKLERTPAIR